MQLVSVLALGILLSTGRSIGSNEVTVIQHPENASVQIGQSIVLTCAFNKEIFCAWQKNFTTYPLSARVNLIHSSSGRPLSNCSINITTVIEDDLDISWKCSHIKLGYSVEPASSNEAWLSLAPSESKLVNILALLREWGTLLSAELFMHQSLKTCRDAKSIRPLLTKNRGAWEEKDFTETLTITDAGTSQDSLQNVTLLENLNESSTIQGEKVTNSSEEKQMHEVITEDLRNNTSLDESDSTCFSIDGIICSDTFIGIIIGCEGFFIVVLVTYLCIQCRKLTKISRKGRRINSS